MRTKSSEPPDYDFVTMILCNLRADFIGLPDVVLPPRLGADTWRARSSLGIETPRDWPDPAFPIRARFESPAGPFPVARQRRVNPPQAGKLATIPPAINGGRSAQRSLGHSAVQQSPEACLGLAQRRPEFSLHGPPADRTAPVKKMGAQKCSAPRYSLETGSH